MGSCSLSATELSDRHIDMSLSALGGFLCVQNLKWSTEPSAWVSIVKLQCYIYYILISGLNSKSSHFGPRRSRRHRNNRVHEHMLLLAPHTIPASSRPTKAQIKTSESHAQNICTGKDRHDWESNLQTHKRICSASTNTPPVRQC